MTTFSFPPIKIPEHIEDAIANYENSEDCNDAWMRFSLAADTIPLLKQHRDFVEENSLGFGDRAFHYMWLLLLDYVGRRRLSPHLLEIGVYKGQVISLWALLAKALSWSLGLHAITPCSGTRAFSPGSLPDRALRKLSKRYRNLVSSGNVYRPGDYYTAIASLFEHFTLDIRTVDLLKGYSTTPEIIHEASRRSYSIVYVDGDHRFESVLADIRNFSQLVCDGGFLVMDDASCNLPGTVFAKGHQSVSDACRVIDSLYFKNVLNVGHNRVYQRVENGNGQSLSI